MSVAALIVAAGQGTRFGAKIPKQFFPLGGKPILFHSIEIFQNMAEFDEIYLVLPRDQVAGFHKRYDLKKYPKLVGFGPGHARRQDSVFAGLSVMPPTTDLVAIHDAVRPFAPPEAIAEAIERAREMGAAILAAPAVDTPKLCRENGRIVRTLERSQVWLAQTPQVFRYSLIRRAYEQVIADSAEVTDDAAAVERLDHPVEVVAATRPNPKITHPEDLEFAEWLLRRR